MPADERLVQAAEDLAQVSDLGARSAAREDKGRVHAPAVPLRRHEAAQDRGALRPGDTESLWYSSHSAACMATSFSHCIAFSHIQQPYLTHFMVRQNSSLDTPSLIAIREF